MAIKITKEELGTILKRLAKASNIKELNAEIDDIADEYNIDLTEIDEEEEEKDMYLSEDEVDMTLNGNWDDEEEDY